MEHLSNTPSGTERHPRTILFVEPEILVRMTVADYLRNCGYVVVEAFSGEDAVAVMSMARPVDIVLADVRLPGELDGFGLATWARDNHPGVEVILTSGVRRCAEKASELCGDSPLRKPYQPHELAQRINLLLERRRTRS
jgi:DNA-binding response OmpR family regulator